MKPFVSVAPKIKRKCAVSCFTAAGGNGPILLNKYDRVNAEEKAYFYFFVRRGT